MGAGGGGMRNFWSLSRGKLEFFFLSSLNQAWSGLLGSALFGFVWLGGLVRVRSGKG